MLSLVDETQIERIMSRGLLAMSITSSSADMAKKMTERQVGAILIIDHENKPVGIVTERDIVRKACSQNVPLESVPAALLMSAPIIFVEASDTLRTAVELMVKHRLRHLAVKRTLTDKQVIGILSVVDIIRYIGTKLIFADGPSSIFSLLSSLQVE